MAGVAKRELSREFVSSIVAVLFINKTTIDETNKIERFVWRLDCRLKDIYYPLVKYLKHNTFQLYALKNTLFYVLLMQLLPVRVMNLIKI